MRMTAATRKEVTVSLFRAGRFVLVSGTYLILYVCFRDLAPELRSFPEGVVWNLPAGLSLGLLLGYGLPYLPVVFLAQLLAPFGADTLPISAAYLVFQGSIKAGFYALTTFAIRKSTRQPRIDLANRKTFVVFFLVLPVIAGLNSSVLMLDSALAGLISWNNAKALLLPGILANMCGIVMITPFVLITSGWEWPRHWLDRISGASATPVPGTSIKRKPSMRRLSLLLVAMAGCLYLLFGFSISDGFLLFCVLSLPVIMLSLAFGLRGVTPFLFAVGIIASSKAQGGQWNGVESQLAIIAAAMNSIVIGRLSSEGKQQQGTISRQAAMLNSVSFVTEQLLGMTDQEKNINEVLRHLAVEANISRIYVLENRQDDRSDCSVLYECSGTGDRNEDDYSEVNSMRGAYIRSHPEALAQGQALQVPTRDLPEHQQAELLSHGIHIGIILPIFADGRWWGCLGLDQCSTDQRWPEAEVSAFKTTARVLGALLAHANVEQQFRQFTGSIPAVFWIASPNLLFKTYVSPAYEQVWGRPCESIYEKPDSWIGAIYHEDYAVFRAIIDQKGAEYDLEYRIVRPDREVRWIRDTAFPVRDASGGISRFVGIAQDITRQKEAEERLRATSILLSALIDNLQVGILVEDHSRRVMHVNQAFCRMFDVTAPRESLLGMDSRLMVKQQQSYGKRIDQIIRAGVACRGEEMVTSNRRIFSRDYIPLSVDGNCHHHLWQYEDITERRRSEEQIRASLKEKEVLLKEIHHRVKNNLQIISSLLNLQSMQIRDQRTAQVFKDSQSRVKAMALVHERLYQSADLARIDFAGYVEDVTHHLLRSYQTRPRGVQLKIEVDPISLNIDTAIPCALIINELVSNSLKYAFPDGRQGEIRVCIKQGSDDELNLVISDNGVGFPSGVSFETTDSLGLQLVRSLAEQLNGKVQYRQDGGMEFQIQFRPLANESRNAAAG